MSIQISISSASESDLKLTSLMVSERLGELFNLDVEFESADTGIDLSGMLSTPMTVMLENTGSGFDRYFNGIVCEAEQTGVEKIKDLSYAKYRVKLVPKPWLLTNVIDCRIFKEMSSVDIVKKVLQEVGYTDVEVSLSASYPAREYCVQYRESGLNFINRLMQQEGIYYYFKHSSSTHTMVLADGVGSHSTADGFADVPYLRAADIGKGSMTSVTEWTSLRGVDGVKISLTDYNPLTPKASLLSNASSDGNGAQGVEIFDYPGTHQVSERGKHYAQMRAEALSASRSRYAGATFALGVTIGGLFTLGDHPRSDLNVEYLVTGTAMMMSTPGFAAGAGGGAEPTFRCRFEALESKLPWRTPQTAEKPIIPGLQTAIVTGAKNEGAADEDIVVDKYGRVQVNFHWNMPDKKNADNSCPVRVATMWAGKNWGAVNYPRVGHEVVVSFIDGDPERPLIVGSVYHAVNMPIHSNFPDEKTKMGFRSRSLLDGADGYSEICIDDKKGEEKVSIHAQKDSEHTVENDNSEKVGNKKEISVHHSLEINVGAELGADGDGHSGFEISKLADWGAKFTELAMLANAALEGDGAELLVGGGNLVASRFKEKDPVAGSQTTNISGVGGQETHILASGGQSTWIISPAGQKTVIGLGPQKTVILEGSQALHVGKSQEVTICGERKHTVKKDDELEVKQDQKLKVEGSRTATIEKDDELTVDGAQMIKVKKTKDEVIDDSYMLKVENSITLKCGEAMITLEKSGNITVKCGHGNFKVNGMNVNLEATTAMGIKGATVEANGKDTTVNGDAAVNIKGGIVKIN